MPDLRARRRRPRGNCRAALPNLAPRPMRATMLAEPSPARGLKLKTVSTFTLIFALLCLAAFAAGRPPASASHTDRGLSVSHVARGVVHVHRTTYRHLPGQ